MTKSNPNQMTITRPGAGIERSQDGVSSTPFWAELLLNALGGIGRAQREETYARSIGAVGRFHPQPRSRERAVGVSLSTSGSRVSCSRAEFQLAVHFLSAISFA